MLQGEAGRVDLFGLPTVPSSQPCPLGAFNISSQLLRSRSFLYDGLDMKGTVYRSNFEPRSTCLTLLNLPATVFQLQFRPGRVLAINLARVSGEQLRLGR